eukprot:3177737-Alexandrium_andersonii.AAC.1
MWLREDIVPVRPARQASQLPTRPARKSGQACHQPGPHAKHVDAAADAAAVAAACLKEGHN